MYWLYLFFTLFHILISCIIYLNKNKKMDLFDPFYLISALYIMVFVYAPAIWLMNAKSVYQGVEVMSQLPYATLVFNLGYLCYVLGSLYVKNNLQKISNVNNLINTQNEDIRIYIVKFASVVFICSIFLAILYYYLIGRNLLSLLTLGQFGMTQRRRVGTGLYFLICFFRSAIPASVLLVAYSKRKKISWICALILADICISTGSRNLAITVMLSFFVFYYIRNNKRPNYVTVFSLIIFFYVFIGFIGIFRGTIKASQNINLSSVNSDALFNAFMYNAEIFYPFYNVVGYIPKYAPYHYGLGIVNIFVQFIPRIIWPGKPTMLGQTAFEVMYGDSMGGAAYPNIGEFYYEFGILGVILFMYITGYVMRRVYINVITEKDELKLIMFSIHFGYIIQFICRGHFASWAIDYIFMLGPIWGLRFILIKKFVKNNKKNYFFN